MDDLRRPVQHLRDSVRCGPGGIAAGPGKIERSETVEVKETARRTQPCSWIPDDTYRFLLISPDSGV
jgi:hypothetical protein